MSSYFTYHNHTHKPEQPYQSGGTSQQYGVIVGTVVGDSEHSITGRSGDHLQFVVVIGDADNGNDGSLRYQVDVNTQSRDGTAIEVYIASETLTGDDTPDQPFGAPKYGVTTDNVALSYAGLGLHDDKFEAQATYRIDSQLEGDLQESTFVAIYGQLFDDGGPNGKGIHETHYNQGHPNQDGAIAIYSEDKTTGALKRTWYFFKFQEDSIPA